jgi:FkbM family methyltransferase
MNIWPPFHLTPLPDWARTLKKGDIAIDCGANAGQESIYLARTGATVYAFEPNPYAFAQLNKTLGKRKNVHCVQAAVGTQDSKVKLYLHENAQSDQLHWSTGSSVLSFKTNVNAATYVNVPQIDLVKFISDLKHPIKFIKMDIEGAECPILIKLIETGLIKDIYDIRCEMHDKKIPEIRKDANKLRDLIKKHNLKQIHLDWR